MTTTITPAETTTYTPEPGSLYVHPLSVHYDGPTPTADDILAAVHAAEVRIPQLSGTHYARYRAEHDRAEAAPLTAMRITHHGLDSDIDATPSMSPTRRIYVREPMSSRHIPFIMEVLEIDGGPLVTGIRPELDTWPITGDLIAYLRQPEDLEATCLHLMEHAAHATKDGRYAEAGYAATYIWALRLAFEFALSERLVAAGRHRGTTVWIDVPTVSQVLHAHGEYGDEELASAYRRDLEMATGYTIEHRFV